MAEMHTSVPLGFRQPTLSEELGWAMKIQATASAKVAALQKLLERFPDLHRSSDRSESECYSTERANTIVTDVEISHACACHRGAALYARPYAEIEGVHIYSDPVKFRIGEGCSGGGEYADYGWRRPFLEAGIPRMIIEKIRGYFDANLPDTYGGRVEEELLV